MKYSHSYIQQYKQCPLSCHLRYDIRLEKEDVGADEHHLKFGAAGHEAMAVLYQGGSVDEAVKAFKVGYPVQLDTEDAAKTLENGIAAIKLYADTHLKKDFITWKVLECEVKESFDFGQEEHFTVKLDLITEHKNQGGVYGWDHKFVGGKRATLSYDYWGEFNPNSQITKYYAHIQKKYGDCSGFYINAVGMRFLKRAYKGEPAGFHPKFERQLFNRTKDQVSLEEVDTTYWIKRIEQDRVSNYFGMNTSSCKFCTYRAGICGAGYQWPLDEELILNQYSIKERPQATQQTGVTNA